MGSRPSCVKSCFPAVPMLFQNLSARIAVFGSTQARPRSTAGASLPPSRFPRDAVLSNTPVKKLERQRWIAARCDRCSIFFNSPKRSPWTARLAAAGPSSLTIVANQTCAPPSLVAILCWAVHDASDSAKNSRLTTMLAAMARSPLAAVGRRDVAERCIRSNANLVRQSIRKRGSSPECPQASTCPSINEATEK